MLPKLSVTFTCRGTLANVSEMSPELLLATTSAAASPVTEMFPKLSCSRVSPVTPSAWMSPELLSSRMLPSRPAALMVPKLSDRCTVPVSREAVRSPELSDSVTVPCRPLASSVAERVADADRQPGRDGEAEVQRCSSRWAPGTGDRAPARPRLTGS